MNTESINKLRKYMVTARGLRTLHSYYKELIKNSNYDKHSLQFVSGDARGMNHLYVSVSLEAYKGTYGSSSVNTLCNPDGSIDREVSGAAFFKALNKNKELILQDMAMFVEQEAKTMKDSVDEELTKIKSLVDELENV